MQDLSASHTWEPITDLPVNWLELARPDLDETLKLWTSEKNSLKDPNKAEKLHERLAMLWAIETGVIERLYTIDRGTTETLLDLGFEAIERLSSNGRVSHNAVKLIEDQKAALNFLFEYVTDERELTNSYVKELHHLLVRNQKFTEGVDQFRNTVYPELIAGDWKKLPNNPRTAEGPIHEYCPPDFVQDEMDTLIRLHQEHNSTGVRPEVEAAWLHHRFTQIHPFQDGNGRVARALATLVFIKAGFLPLVIRDVEHREVYLDALEAADQGEIGSLIGLISNIQAKDLEDAVTYVREIRGAGIDTVARAAAEAAKRRQIQDEAALAERTVQYSQIATQLLEEANSSLTHAFSEAGLTLNSFVGQNSDQNETWWNQQIISAARQFGYFADLGRSRRWVQLRLDVQDVPVPRWNLIVSLHHKEARTGLMAVVVLLTSSDNSLEESRPVVLGSDHEFTFSSTSSRSEDAYRKWLDDAIRNSLEVWQSKI